MNPFDELNAGQKERIRARLKKINNELSFKNLKEVKEEAEKIQAKKSFLTARKRNYTMSLLELMEKGYVVIEKGKIDIISGEIEDKTELDENSESPYENSENREPKSESTERPYSAEDIENFEEGKTLNLDTMEREELKNFIAANDLDIKVSGMTDSVIRDKIVEALDRKADE